MSGRFSDCSHGASARLPLRFPASGCILPKFPELSYRELIVSPYRFFYRVVGRTVWVVPVWQGA